VVDPPAHQGFGARLKLFGRTPVGFALLVLLIVAISGLLVGALGLPVGAALMLVVAFGVPVYLGWKTSLKLLLIVALACLVGSPLFAGLVVTDSAFSPPAILSSTDGVLENVSLSPFQANSGSGSFAFNIDTFPSKIPGEYGARLAQVYVWVSNCQYATDSSKPGSNPCYLSPALVFKNFTYDLTPAQQNSTGSVPIVIDATGLPSGQIFYFIVLTAVSNKTTGVWYYALNSNIGGWSCTVQPSYNGCSYAEGPITTGFAGVYELLLLGTYLSVSLVVAVLVAIILIYNYLKGRERLRKAKAKAAAEGEASPLSHAEVRCPSCNAVVDAGETTCWKCGKSLSSSGGKAAPVRSATPAGSPAPKPATEEPESAPPETEDGQPLASDSDAKSSSKDGD
jgi:hypothetical protein